VTDYIFSVSFLAFLPIVALFAMMLHDIYKYRDGKFFEEPKEKCEEEEVFYL
jgi:hypothetical protein